jgi:hypothetical protein
MVGAITRKLPQSAQELRRASRNSAIRLRVSSKSLLVTEMEQTGLLGRRFQPPDPRVCCVIILYFGNARSHEHY